jgi:hypothetical protein
VPPRRHHRVRNSTEIWGRSIYSMCEAQVRSRSRKDMKQIHVWPNHIRVRPPDLVLVRAHEETLASSLTRLARLGFDTHPDNVEVHAGVTAT